MTGLKWVLAIVLLTRVLLISEVAFLWPFKIVFFDIESKVFSTLSVVSPFLLIAWICADLCSIFCTLCPPPNLSLQLHIEFPKIFNILLTMERNRKIGILLWELCQIFGSGNNVFENPFKNQQQIFLRRQFFARFSLGSSLSNLPESKQCSRILIGKFKSLGIFLLLPEFLFVIRGVMLRE